MKYLILFFLSIATLHAQQTVFCVDNIISNGDFETSTNVCSAPPGTGFGSANQVPRIWLDQSPVQGWVGTANRIDNNISFPTGDYYNAACTNINGSNCASGSGAVGMWMHFFGREGREYIQTSLNQPLKAGAAYCISVKAVTTDNRSAANRTNKLGFWFHNNIFANGTSFVDIVADNANETFIGPGSRVNAQPQVSNPSNQFFGTTCDTYNYSFCADGGETNLVIGNFVAGNSDSGESEYLTIDDLVISEACPVDFDFSLSSSGVCGDVCFDLTANALNPVGGCEVTNNFTYQWLLNGTPIAGQTNPTITNICPDGTNVYSVEVDYSAGCLSITKDLTYSSSFLGPDAGEDGSVDLCAASNNIDLFTQLGGSPDIGGVWTPGLNSGTGVFDPAIDRAGTYTYTVSGLSSCPDDSAMVVVTVNPTPLVDDLPDVTVCDAFTLPVLTNGDYFTATNGGGTALNSGDVISTTQTVFIYNETQSTPNCSSETDFVITVNPTPLVDDLPDVTVCDTFTLPTLTNGNYFTATNGGGTALNSGDVINTTQTIFVYNDTKSRPNCSAETDFIVTVEPTPLVDDLPDVTVCDTFTLPALTNGNYFTATNGGGTALNSGDVISTTQTIFIYNARQSTPNCSSETDFVIIVNTTPIVDDLSDVIVCDTFTLPVLTNGNYFTATNGGGTALNSGDVINTTQTIFVYNDTKSRPNCSAETDFIVTVEPTPLVDDLPDVTVCDTFTLPALTNGNYFTATNGGGTALNSGDVISTTQTIFIYNARQSTPNCSSETDFVIIVNTTPIVDDLPDVTVCDTFTLPTLTNGNYFTATNGGGTALNSGDVINTTQTIFVYNDTKSRPNCSAETDFIVTVEPTPLVDDLPDVTVCDAFTLPVLTNGDYFTATNGGGTALNSGAVINTTQTIFIYNETQSTPNCSSETDFVITVNPTPLVDDLPDVTVCDAFTLPVLTNGNYFTATNGGGTALNSGDVINTTQTIFVYNETQSTPNCSSETDFVITVNPTPLVDDLPDVIVCDAFTLPVLTNGDYFTAINGGGTALNSGDVISTTQTIFIYNETQSTPNCSAETDFIVTVNLTPIVDDLPDVTVCDTFTLPALTNGNYFTASNGGGTRLNAGAVINTTQAIFIYNETQSTPSCSVETDFVVTVNQTPIADDLPDVTVCDTFTLPILTNGNYFTASNGGGDSLDAGDIISTTQTIFVYSETQSTPNCSTETDFIVTVNLTPLADDLPDVTTCDSYTLPVLTNGNYFTASNGSGTRLNAGAVIISTQTVFIYNETQSVPNCSTETDFIITINNALTIPTLSTIFRCTNENTTFDLTENEQEISLSFPLYTVQGYYTSLNSAENQSDAIINPNDFVLEEISQTVFVGVVSPEGCYTITDFIIQNIDFIAFIDGDNVLCLDENGIPAPNQNIELSVDLDPNLYSFEWTLNGDVLPFSDNLITINALGNYGVTVTDNNIGCVSQDSDFVVSGSARPSNFGATVNPGSFSDNFSILATAEGIGNYEFSLDGGLFQDSGLFEVAQGGPHFITIRDREINGCFEIVIDLCILDYPKFFTPNGDGNNDFWNLISPECGEIRRLVIFDRYGKLIKQIENFDEGWDGSYNGKVMPSTDYWFLVDYFENGELKTFRNHFSLKR